MTAIEYQIDDGAWATCTADDGTIDELSETFSCTLTTLSDGSYSVNIRATDSLSNTTSGASLGADNFDVDAPDPDPTPTPTPTPSSSGSSSSSSRSSSRRSSECTAQKPDSTPDLFQINATNTSVKLFFTPSSGNRDRYFVMYGLMSGAEQYGLELLNSTNGVISVDINDLVPGTTYYFKVQARNGCKAGDWSNELAATAGQRFPSYKWGSVGRIITTAVNSRVNPGAVTNTTTNFSNTQLPVEEPTTTTPAPITVPIATPRAVAQPTPAPTPAPQQQSSPGFFEKITGFIRNIFN
ncbi:MAG: hypothetical protein QG639_957 [Patescibacteria group bacterium]|nr:hypothetical protein [Patescibacteria group bacterium]